MKKTVILFLAMSAFCVSKAQNFQWAKSISGGGNSDVGNAVTTDVNGNVYVIGSFTGTADFDPGANTANLTAVGSGSSVFFSKYDSNGNYVWAKRIGHPTENCEGNNIKIDANGNIFITGGFTGLVDFDPTASTSGTFELYAGANSSTNAFVAKYDNNGNPLNAISIGSSSYDNGLDLAIDEANNIYITGNFVGTVNFNPTGTAIITSAPAANNNAFFAKYTNTLSYVYAKSIECQANSGSLGKSIEFDTHGNILLAGEFSGTADFNTGALVNNLTGTSSGYLDGFIAKYDSLGNYRWAIKVGGMGSDLIRDISTDSSDNVFVTGYFNEFTSSPLDFDPGAGVANLSSFGFADGFFAKYDSLGNYSWAKRFGGITAASPNTEMGESITVDKQTGDVYILGTSYQSVKYDDNSTVITLSASGHSLFMAKCDNDGNYLWVSSIGNLFHEYGKSLCLDQNNNIICTGKFWSASYPPDFDPNLEVHTLTSVSLTDVFIAKYNCGTFASDSAATCNSNYTWNGNTYTTSGIYNITVPVSGSCDSIYTLKLTIDGIQDLTTTTVGNTLTANQSGVNYQWIDCNNNNAAISGENAQTFNPSISGNYAVVLSNTNCSDTTACINFTFSSVGINKLENNGNLQIYPNPASNSVSLTNIVKGSTIKILDVTGKLIYNQKVNSSSGIIETTTWSNGMYFIQIENEGAIAQKKLIINK